MPGIKKILFVVFLLFSQWSMGQMSNYKSLYIYHFIKRIEWPKSPDNKDFVIIVMGDDKTLAALQQIAISKTVNQKKIRVSNTNNLDSISNINLIYVGYSKRKYIAELAKLIGKQPILLVSETKNNHFTDINLLEDDDGLEFDVIVENIRKKGLKISDDLLKLSKQKD
jgi:hypothetical protein